MPPGETPHAPLVGVRHYDRLPEAREAALALAAKGLSYEIDPAGDGWVLLVEEGSLPAALEELREFEKEEIGSPQVIEAQFQPLKWGPLLWSGVVMAGFFQVQQSFGEWWTDAGVADGEAMLMKAEWWRAVTALTLHADLPHLLANMLTGLTFAAFLQARWGSGFAWLLIILSGAAGNVVNAWGYRGEPHFSLGASTAVFGALGLLVAEELLARWRGPGTRTRWHLIVPLGAGFSLLAFLGVGEKHEHIDFMAHCWGFLCGILLGLAASSTVARFRSIPALQRAAAVAVLALVGFAWWRATTR